jgi:hypothetical protein
VLHGDHACVKLIYLSPLFLGGLLIIS